MPKYSFPRWLMAALGLAALALLAGGAWFYRAQEQALQREAEAELTAIAQLKVDQIARWRVERLADAVVLVEDPFLITAFARWLVAPQADDAEQILIHFRSLQERYHYIDVLLVDAEGQVRLSLGYHPGSLHEEVAQLLDAALRERQPMLSDLHAGPGDLPPHIDVVAPFFADDTPGARPLGAVIFQSDARQFLYPLIQAWPTPSRTAETLLVRRDGDEVLFLNELRHQTDTALKLRFPLSQTDLPAVMAVLGQRGVVQGKDYRGVEVLSVLRAVPDSAWFMVTKVDAAEALSVWQRESTLILVLLLGLVLIAAVGAAAVWQQNEAAHYRALYAAETAIRRAETNYQELADSITDIFFAMDQDLRYTYWNRASEILTGIPAGDALGKSPLEVFPNTAEIRRAEKVYRDVLATQKSQVFENDNVLAKDHYFFETSVYPSQRGISVFARDVTARKQAEEQLRLQTQRIEASLREKEVLLREIHHRVKNNLQIASTLLDFQADATGDERVREAFRESQNRFRSMAAIHEYLYQSPDLAQVEMEPYLHNLGVDLQRVYSAHAITLKVEAPGVVLDLEKATPCGLLVNELVSNAIKHAFPTGRGAIEISMHPEGERMELSVGDNGIGLPPDLDIGKTESLGLGLVGMLVQQLRGTLEVDGQQGAGRQGTGTRFRLTFPVPATRS